MIGVASMKRGDDSETWTFFRTSNVVSESKPWFVSLFHYLRDWTDKASVDLSGITAAPVPVDEVWTEHHAVVPRILSLLMHAAIVFVLVIPPAVAPRPLPKSVVDVALYSPSFLIAPSNGKSGGGGGGGKHELTPSSLGRLPRPSDKQFLPPDPEPTKNLDPTLVVEPTVVAPQLASLPPVAAVYSR